MFGINIFTCEFQRFIIVFVIDCHVGRYAGGSLSYSHHIGGCVFRPDSAPVFATQIWIPEVIFVEVEPDCIICDKNDCSTCANSFEIGPCRTGILRYCYHVVRRFAIETDYAIVEIGLDKIIVGCVVGEFP